MSVACLATGIERGVMTDSPERYFFELPIYRVSESVYSAEFHRHLARFWDETERMHGRAREEIFSDDQRALIQEQQWRNFGGPWRYNQVVGWVRLFVLGFQIRGEYWMVTSQRLTRRGRRDFRYSSHAFTFNCSHGMSSDEIRDAVVIELAEFQRECRNGRLFLDVTCFDNAAQCIDWRRILGFTVAESV